MATEEDERQRSAEQPTACEADGNALSLNLNQNTAKHTPKHKCTTNNNFEHKRVLHNLRFMGFIINGQSAKEWHCKKIFDEERINSLRLYFFIILPVQTAAYKPA